MKIRLPLDHSSSGSTPRGAFRCVAACALGCALVAASTYGVAQITSPSGPQSPDNNTSAMGTRPDPATSAIHESHVPQAKDAKGSAKGATAGKNSKPEGAGGFGNGLYGTGAGSNK
ncbi:MAG TPA: beta-xylosidase [Paraburkholderia sp.]|jgi:hypothetical protein